MKKTRVLIADDHSVVREGIRLVLRSSEGFSIVGEAGDGEEAVRLAGRLRPDVVIMDISMPRLGGIDAAVAMKRDNPGVRIVILTVHEEEEYVQEMLRAGASGYVLKSAGRREILAAIRSAMSGGRFFSPGVSSIIIDGFIARTPKPPLPAGADAQPDGGHLTSREKEIVRYIARGYTNRKIAETLFLSIRTVNTHRTNLMQKLNIHDTATLVRYALDNGLAEPTAG